MADSKTLLDGKLAYRAPSKQRITEIASLIKRCGDMIEAGQSAQKEVAQLNVLSRITFDHDLLANYWRWTSAQGLAMVAASVPPPVISNISRDQLIAIAAQIQNGVGSDEGAQRWYLDLFEANTPSGTSDLFFWPTEVSGWKYTGGDISTAEPTPEEIVERALISDVVSL